MPRQAALRHEARSRRFMNDRINGTNFGASWYATDQDQIVATFHLVFNVETTDSTYKPSCTPHNGHSLLKERSAGLQAGQLTAYSASNVAADRVH